MSKIKYLLLIIILTIVYLIFIQPTIRCHTRDCAIKEILIYINENFSNEIQYKKIIKESKEDSKVASNVGGMVWKYLHICYYKDSNELNKIEEIMKHCKKDVKKEYLENYLKLFR